MTHALELLKIITSDENVDFISGNFILYGCEAIIKDYDGQRYKITIAKEKE